MSSKLRQEYLISYDIEDSKVRKRTFNEFGKYGLKSVQKSVFWGYLTLAEINAIKRYLNAGLSETDKLLITRTNLNSRGQSYLIGHTDQDFCDWDEIYVI
ncbi:MAG: CRISPR-associated endonuclease Cas2 [Gammaproteobacteria bacterium]|nr:CRISPR-associated endonuclease Cas2 [Gammaproteobacteria bacterium]